MVRYVLKQSVGRAIGESTLNHRIDWFDLHVRKNVAYLLMNYMNKMEIDTVQMNKIPEDQWKQYYKNLWYNPAAIGTAKEDKLETLRILGIW